MQYAHFTCSQIKFDVTVCITCRARDIPEHTASQLQLRRFSIASAVALSVLNVYYVYTPYTTVPSAAAVKIATAGGGFHRFTARLRADRDLWQLTVYAHYGAVTAAARGS